jgi:2-polyprenyl-3-methyl-5-hydroxy-6-metoxy-1,4-benzoquinol methylase
VNLSRVRRLLGKVRRRVAGGGTRAAAPVELRGEAVARRLRPLMTGVPWCVDDVVFADGSVEVSGWVIASEREQPDVSIRINGAPFDEQAYPSHREDLARLFWFLPHAGQSGFRCRSRLARGQAFAQGFLRLEAVSRRTGAPFDPGHAYYLLDDARDRIPLPEPARRQRAHGGPQATAFRLEGYSTFRKLSDTLGRHGRAFAEGVRVLDWGCGCGRLSRYLTTLTPATITGIDIDADNAGWCAAHLPAGRFAAIARHPPTDLPDGAFDVIVGISIFTHLREREQFEWLAELRRLTAAGGLVLVTTHADASVCRADFNDQALTRWQADGFLDSGKNVTLEVAGDAEYYRDTYHTRRYIEQRWREYFRIVEIVPGYIGNHQDLVVMTP